MAPLRRRSVAFISTSTCLCGGERGGNWTSERLLVAGAEFPAFRLLSVDLAQPPLLVSTYVNSHVVARVIDLTGKI